jgi:curli production assembly/transport component CsgG
MKARRIFSLAAALAALVFGGGCAHTPSGARDNAQLTPDTAITRDLLALPPPKGKIAVAVYGIRDQTGQYKPAPDSSFSTAVSQGASSMLIRALQDSGWFVPVERENLQNLLTERKIVRALEMPQPAGTPAIQVPPLLAASVLIEGGIVAFENNVRTGGVGARFLGVGLSTQYRVDQVTVNLRTVDIRGGQILQSISTTKTIYSYELHPSVFKFVNVKDLAEFEAGTTRNEPTQLCVTEAIEAAVTHLVAQGVKAGNWTLQDEADRANPVLQRYLGQVKAQRSAMRARPAGADISRDIGPDVGAGSRVATAGTGTGGAP